MNQTKTTKLTAAQCSILVFAAGEQLRTNRDPERPQVTITGRHVLSEYDESMGSSLSATAFAMPQKERAKLVSRLVRAAGWFAESIQDAVSIGGLIHKYYRKHKITANNDQISLALLMAYIDARGIRSDLAAFLDDPDNAESLRPENLGRDRA